jgi:Sec-independent protein translocase protein TatA
MNISFGQILIIAFVFVFFFGNFSNIIKNIAGGIKIFQDTFR